ESPRRGVGGASTIDPAAEKRGGRIGPRRRRRLAIGTQGRRAGGVDGGCRRRVRLRVRANERTLGYLQLLDAIGRTPLIELRHIVPAGAGRIVAKLESANPTGSMKDRM